MLGSKFRASTVVGYAVGLMVATSLVLPGVANAADVQPYSCPPDGPSTHYTFTNVATSTRPTDIKSAYITGPGTITYSDQTTASVSASASASVTAEAGVVFASASATIGVSVSAGHSWSQSFSYALQVPAGQRRAMQLFQESRSFNVTKQIWNPGKCTFVNSYVNQPANAPRTANELSWLLVS